MPDAEDKDELLRRFDAAISEMGLAELRELAGNLSLLTHDAPLRAGRPELRRTPRDTLARYRIRVDLDGAEPPIWRRLDLRSDLSLDVLHQVLQVAFGWTDVHLHRFALGGHPFDRQSQLFLCAYDVQEGELDDEGGIPEAGVRLDEALQEPGDVLHYVYDYGDSWQLSLCLEDVLPAAADALPAVVVDGGRAAPPENSGGMADGERPAESVGDSACLDRDELNGTLSSPSFVLRGYGFDDRLVDLVQRLDSTRVGETLASRLLALGDASQEPTPEEGRASLPAEHEWFLDAGAGGTDLTAAAEAATAPSDPAKVWDHLAGSLVPTHEGFETDATLLLLAFVATSADQTAPLGDVAAALSELGWRHRDGHPLEEHVVRRLPAFHVLGNVAPRQAELGEDRISPAAAALARAALLRQD